MKNSNIPISDDPIEYSTQTGGSKPRPRTARPLTREEIQDRNRTFRKVSRINLKRAQEIKMSEHSYYPPNK